MEKYTIKIKNSTFTIPKENIRLLAMTKAMDLGQKPLFNTNEEAISFLEKLGCTINE